MTISSALPYDITTGFDTNHDTVANDRPLGMTRNAGRGTPSVGIDLRVTKLFRLHYKNFVGVFSSPLFGHPSSSYPARTIQFSFRYQF
jgi:hypothetical protein